jgi:serine/threonine protein kinase
MAQDKDSRERVVRPMGQEPALALIQTAVAGASPEPAPENPARGPAALPIETAAPPPEFIAGAAPPNPVLLHAGATLKHYEILRKLGEGGMGTVLLARDTKLGRLVAIKVLLEHSGPSAARFLAEARTTARCKHENIVVIHEVDELHGTPYMVLEYLEGRMLRDVLSQREQPGASTPPESSDTPPALVSSSRAAELVIPVVRALSCAHKLGIVHRDLKPENIFLTDAGAIKVLDFGIAKGIDAGELSVFAATVEPFLNSAGLTEAGAIVGTLPYMSPEQWRSEEIDGRSDLWAVGIILYELVTGVHPLAPFSMPRLAQVRLLDPPMPSVRDKRPDLDALGAIIDRCLKKRRAERFGSAEELLAALEPILAGRNAHELREGESPFAGLSAFQEADAARFFGRSREVQSLMGLVRNQPLVVVAGPSGAGKSSFVRAGVIPALKRSGERWETFIVRPGRRPLAALSDLLAEVAPATPEALPPGALAASAPEALLAAFRTQPGLIGAQLRACSSISSRSSTPSAPARTSGRPSSPAWRARPTTLPRRSGSSCLCGRTFSIGSPTIAISSRR